MHLILIHLTQYYCTMLIFSGCFKSFRRDLTRPSELRQSTSPGSTDSSSQRAGGQFRRPHGR